MVCLLNHCLPCVDACGATFCSNQAPIVQAAEIVIFGVEETSNDTFNVTMQVQINYQGPPDEFAWLLPVPSQPSISTGSAVLFQALEDATRPSYTLDIKAESDTCTAEFLESKDECIMLSFTDADGGGVNESEDDVNRSQDIVVLEEGSIGPYEFAIIDAEEGSGDAAFDWLANNGYDQPARTKPLVKYYADTMGMVLVALRLRSETDAGQIEPVTLEYEMQGNLTEVGVGCVPIQLTQISTVNDLPVLVLGLGPSRMIPLNYGDITLNQALIDWIGCSSNGPGSFADACFENSHRALVADALNNHGLNSRAFFTDFAGDSTPFSNSVALTQFEESSTYTNIGTPFEFLLQLANDGMPAVQLVENIILKYITIDNCPFIVTVGTPVYQPQNVALMQQCQNYFDGSNFDATALFNDLYTLVVKPSQDAQEWLNGHAYLTRLYLQFDTPGDMTDDPVFGFSSNEPDVSNTYQAEAFPKCSSGEIEGLDLVIQGHSSSEQGNNPVHIPASLSCGRWVADNGPILNLPTSSRPENLQFALDSVGGLAFGEDEEVRFTLGMQGQFDEAELAALWTFLDARAPNQTIDFGAEEESTSGDKLVGSSVFWTFGIATLFAASIY